MVPTGSSELTGGLTYEDRRGTLVDWNLCFTADGTSSSRSFRSGTPAFMAQDLLENKKLTRRTLGHDMESFFTAIIWIASLDFENEQVFLKKPLTKLMLNNKKSPDDVYSAKSSWFELRGRFQLVVINHLQVAYRRDNRFTTCISALRQIIFSEDRLYSIKVGNTDPEEELFRKCMKTIDDYLGETKGCDEMKEIDSQAQLPPAQRWGGGNGC